MPLLYCRGEHGRKGSLPSKAREAGHRDCTYALSFYFVASLFFRTINIKRSYCLLTICYHDTAVNSRSIKNSDKEIPCSLRKVFNFCAICLLNCMSIRGLLILLYKIM